MDREELMEELKIELDNIKRLNNEMKVLLNKTGDSPSFIEIRSASSILHDFYSGIEKIFPILSDF